MQERQPMRILWRTFTNNAGFTLVEVLVGLGILTAITASFSSSLFQASSIQRFWKDDVVATKEWRHAGSWFAGDALIAQTTSLVDGDPPVEGVTLNWAIGGLSHTAEYRLSGTALLRIFDNRQIVVASQVVSVGFSRSGQIVTFDLEVRAERAGTERMSLKTYLRVLQ